MVTLKSALEMLQNKIVIGEYGPATRPFVVLDVDEYNTIVRALQSATAKRVPRESKRREAAAKTI